MREEKRKREGGKRAGTEGERGEDVGGGGWRRVRERERERGE